MTRAVFLLAFVVFGTRLPGAEPFAVAAASNILNPEREGQELAAKLRSSAPAENSDFTGVLEITSDKGSQRFVPIVSRITVSPTNWHVVYESRPTNSASAEKLTITHSPGRKPVYTLTAGTNLIEVRSLAIPFAASDFWLLDLGLEFLHWPRQRAIRAEMSRTRPCRVLESVNPNHAGNGYARVLSWVDNETGGVLQAEAYDSTNAVRPLKKFALGTFKKIEGHYQVLDMRMRNTRTGQQTELKRDFKER